MHWCSILELHFPPQYTDFCKPSNVVSKEAFNVETVHVKILYDLQTTSSSKFSVTFHLPLFIYLFFVHTPSHKVVCQAWC